MISSDSDSDLERNRQCMFNAVSVKRKKGREISEEERCGEVQGYLDEGVGINAVDDEGNTVLHVAVKRGFVKVVEFLLAKRARTNIENNQSDTAITLAEKLGKREIVRIIGEFRDNPSGPFASTSKTQRFYNHANDSRSIASSTSRKRTADIEIVDSVKKLKLAVTNETQRAMCRGSGGRSSEQEHRRDGDVEEGWAIKEVHPARGLKTSTHGVMYQVQHLVLNLYRASKMRRRPRFRLTTELESAGKFDDLVFEYEDGMGGRSHRFVQLKHKQEDAKEQIRMNDFSAADTEPFSLSKYLISWRRIKKHPDFSGSQSKMFILCTNIGLDLNGFDDKHIHVIPVRETDEFLKVTCEEDQPARYKLRVEKMDNCKLCNKLKLASDVQQLATELAKCVSNVSSQSINSMSDVFKYYQAPLTEEIIDVESGKFSEKFIRKDDGSGRLSGEAEILRRVFLEQVKKLPENRTLSDLSIWDRLKMKDLKISEGFVASARLNLAKLKLASDIKRLAKELAECVYNQSSQGINLKNDIFEEYRAPILQEILDIESGKFSKKFINNNDESDPLSNEAKHLRRMFLEHATIFSENHTFSEEDIRNNLKSRTLRVTNEFVISAHEKLDCDIREFAENLAECVYDASPRGRNLTIDMIHYYQAPLVREILDLQTGKFLDKFINNQNRSGCLSNKAAKLCEIFFEKAKQFPVNNGVTDGDIWNNLKNVELKMSEEFVASARLTRTQLIESVRLPDDHFSGNGQALLEEINTFLDEFILAVKQPNEVKLGNMIEDEFRKDGQFNLLNANLIKNSFDTAIMNWFKKKQGEFLVREDADYLFDDLSREIACLMTAGLNLFYSERLKSYGVSFTSEMEDLSNFLNSSKTVENQIWQFISSKQTLLTALRIYQTLRKMKNYKEDDSHIFIDLKHLESVEIRERVLGAFQSPSSHYLLVVDCCSIDATKYGQKLWYRLFNITRNNPRKRVIIIIEGNYDSAIDFEVGCKTSHVRDEDISIDNVEPYSLRKLLKKMVVRFQGHDEKTSLGRLLCHNDSDETRAGKFERLEGIIDSNTLVKLIQGEEIPIGDKVEGLGEIEDYYIPRYIDPRVVIKSDILIAPEIHDIFAVSGIDNMRDMEKLLEAVKRRHSSDKSNEMRRGNQNEYVFLENDAETNGFANLCQWNPHRNIHWLQAESEKFVWKQSFGHIENLIKYREECRGEDDDDGQGAILLTEERLGEDDGQWKTIILSDTAGMGKSTVLTRLAKRMKNKDPGLLVIRIDLTQHTNALHVRKNNKSCKEVAAGEAADFLLKDLLRRGRNLEFSIFKTIITDQSEAAAILFDGFDEISPDYGETVIDLLQDLAKLKLKKLFVTTRPHTREVLEKKLGVFSHTLRLFSLNNQIEFLSRFWSSRCSSNLMKVAPEKQLKRYAEAVIDLLINSIDQRMKEFTGIPLQTRLVAEFFQNLVRCKLSDSVTDSSDEISVTDILGVKKIGILELYSSFVDKKYDIYWDEKKSGNRRNPADIRDYEFQQELFLKAHQKFALDALFDEETAKALLLSQPDVKSCIPVCHRIIEGGERTGIVIQIIDHIPQFVHRTFAEYFAAKFLVNTLKDDDHNQHVRKFVVAQLFVAREYQVIRAFLNCLLEDEDYGLDNNFWKFDLMDHLISMEGQTAYHIAAGERHIGITKFLLNRISEDRRPKHSNINCVSRSSYTALHKAVETADNFDVVKCLVDAGANVNHRDSWHQKTPLHSAIEGVVAYDVVEYLIKKSGNIESQTLDGALCLAAELSNIDAVKYLVQEGASINSRTQNGMTPLHYAAGTGKLDLVKYFLDKGAEICCQSKDGTTPLHKAAGASNLDVVKLIIAGNADIHSRNENGETPLHCAAKSGNLDVVEYLCSKGAIINCQTTYDETPLHKAATAGNRDLMEYLFEKGASIHSQDDNGQAPMHIAAGAGSLDIVKFLVEKGASIHSQTKDGTTPLQYAAGWGHPDVVRYLKDEGGDINAPRSDGKTPLHLAAEFGYVGLARYLIEEAGADIHSLNQEGRTPLQAAGDFGETAVEKYFIEQVSQLSLH